MVPSTTIFIHSLFRAGSTYLFNCFRRSGNGYWCYQEPLNEILLNAATQPDRLLESSEDMVRYLRHPEINRPYFFEFYPLAARIGETFCSSFSYEEYFSNTPAKAQPICRYLTMLAKGAKGRPVFQECRSVGRVRSFRECLGGTHIYLWRNPWDQWWSYKVDSYFDNVNLSILVGSDLPPLFEELQTLLGVQRSSVKQRLDADGSYTLFFALWCHGMLEALPQCDLDLNIDSLSHDNIYSKDILTRLENLGITGLDFSDCSVPISLYGKVDKGFFSDVEKRVFELFLHHGYSSSDLERMNRLRDRHDCHKPLRKLVTVPMDRELCRLRQVVRRLESELGNEVKAVERVLRDKETECMTFEKVFGDKEVECLALEKAIEDKEAERLALDKALEDKEAERLALDKALEQILNSRYWRWGRPLRKGIELAKIFLHRVKKG